MNYVYNEIMSCLNEKDVDCNEFCVYIKSLVRNFIATSDINDSIKLLDNISYFLSSQSPTEFFDDYYYKFISLCFIHSENLEIVEDKSFQKMQNFFLN